MEMINRAMENHLMADSMLEKLMNHSVQKNRELPEYREYETRSQRRARERAEKKSAIRESKKVPA